MIKSVKIKKIISGVVLVGLMGTMLLTGCGKKEVPELNDLTAETVTPDVEPEPEPEPEPEIIEEPEVIEEDNSHEGKARSLTSGLWISEKKANKRPLAVMVGNTSDALPQYGTSEADIIYEIPVEGGITRLMAVFSDPSKAEKVMSVRSCRLYYAEIAATDLDAIYVHFGQAALAKKYLDSSAVANISGLDGNVACAFFRDNTKKAPHNAYITADGVKEAIEAKKYRTEHAEGYKNCFTFADPDEEYTLPTEGTDALKVVPGYQVSKPWLTYDAETDLYALNHFKKAQIDGNNDEQLKFTNILLYSMSGRVVDTKAGYLEMDTVSSGTGKYITGGKCIDITWEKTSLDTPTRFFDANGNELVMRAGKTYVGIIKKGDEDRLEISATLE